MRALARSHLNVFVQSLHLATVFGDLPPASTERRLEVCATASWLPFPNYRYGRGTFPKHASLICVLSYKVGMPMQKVPLDWRKAGSINRGRWRGLTFANKNDCLPLAAADLFAYTAWAKRVGQKPIGAQAARAGEGDTATVSAKR